LTLGPEAVWNGYVNDVWIVELYWQFTGRAEGRQVEAHVSLAQSIGSLDWVTLPEGRR